MSVEVPYRPGELVTSSKGPLVVFTWQVTQTPEERVKSKEADDQSGSKDCSPMVGASRGKEKR